MSNVKKVKTKKDIITLTDKDYKAAGGQGVVYCQNNMAYKIYHDPKKMINVAKIYELNQINRDEVLAPIEPLYDISSPTPIGFTMRYVDNTEFLCKIFTKNYRNANNISPNDIVDLVAKMQKTLTHIHQLGILVVDYNEMNFLFSKDLETVYHIDVDAWQTKNFPADAIMESIRDHSIPKGHFSVLSDWFSWAVVTFQMYIGIHPYKGRHPDFDQKEWSKRMDLGISVFDKNVTIPTGICNDFSVIPKKHLDWYKTIFLKNDRSIPPFADTVAISMAIIKTITSKGDFIVKLLSEFKDSIKNIYFFDNKQFVITNGGIFDHNDKSILDFKKSVDKTPFEMCEVMGEDPFIAYLKKGIVEFFSLDKTLISTAKAEAMFEYNGIIYTVNSGQLIEHEFQKFGKLIHTKHIACNILPSYKVFKNIIIQDDFMKCHLAIPFEKGKCINKRIKELDGKRIIDAKHDGGICIIMSEYQGKYTRSIIQFNNTFSDYEISQEEIDNLYSINFIILPNKMCILIDDEKLFLFKDIKHKKELTIFPFDVSMRLYHNNMQVLFVDDNKLYSVTMK